MSNVCHKALFTESDSNSGLTWATSSAKAVSPYKTGRDHSRPFLQQSPAAFLAFWTVSPLSYPWLPAPAAADPSPTCTPMPVPEARSPYQTSTSNYVPAIYSLDLSCHRLKVLPSNLPPLLFCFSVKDTPHLLPRWSVPEPPASTESPF